MRTVKWSILIAGIPALSLLVSSCASNAHAPDENYVLVADNTKIPYWQAAQQGIAKAASEMKVKFNVLGPDGHDPQGEHDAFKHAVSLKPSGILVSAADASILTPDINAALDQDIPVITIDADAPDSKRLFFVGTDNYQAGMIGGKLAAKLLNGRGSVVVYTIGSQLNLKDRLQGYMAAFGKDINIAQVIDMNGNSDVAFDKTKSLIDSKTKVDAFICLEAIACPAVADVVNRANMAGKVPIIAMDTDPQTIEWINKGVITATIAQKPYTMAYYGTKLVDDIHHHPPSPLAGDWNRNVFAPIPTFVDTGTFVVDKTNVANVGKAPAANQ